jgi:hypothetical protein|mmetsp:Transcript_5964/g.8072  ORF Transcript_5964/g.8072 Transcript_5964/m.8072 type:complete len:80 (-) Transcript_5964:287-526(-)
MRCAFLGQTAPIQLYLSRAGLGPKQGLEMSSGSASGVFTAEKASAISSGFHRDDVMWISTRDDNFSDGDFDWTEAVPEA